MAGLIAKTAEAIVAKLRVLAGKSNSPIIDVKEEVNNSERKVGEPYYKQPKLVTAVYKEGREEFADLRKFYDFLVGNGFVEEEEVSFWAGRDMRDRKGFFWYPCLEAHVKFVPLDK